MEKSKVLSYIQRHLKFRSKLFNRLMLSYVAVIAISLVVYFSMYRYAFTNVYKLVLTSGREAQANAGIQIENVLDEIDTLLAQMSNDSEITSFKPSSNALNSSEYISLYMVQHSIQKYRLTNSIIENLILYYPEADVVCSSSTASARTLNAYSVDFGYESLPYGEWKQRQKDVRYSMMWPEMLLNNGPDELSSSQNRRNVISLVRRFPVNHVGKTVSVATVQIRTKTLDDLLHAGMLAQGAVSFLYSDTDGTIIYRCKLDDGDSFAPEEVMNILGDGEEVRIGGRKKVAFKTEIKGSNLVCLTMFDLNTMMASTTRHKSILIGVLLAVLALEFVYAFVITRFNYRPIRDILHDLPEDHPDSLDELTAIRMSISRMNNESEEIRMQLSEQQQTIRDLCLGRLLGLEPGLDGFDAEQSGLPAACRAHFVFVIYFSSKDLRESGVPSAREDIAALQQKMEERHIAKSIIRMDYFTNTSAFILSASDMKSIRKSISALTGVLEETFRENKSLLTVGIGLPTDNLKQISRSFSEARLAAQEAKLLNRHVVMYEDVGSRQETYDYSSEMEQSLIDNMIAGNGDKSIGIINNVYWKVRESSASSYRLQLLLNEIYGTLLKVRQQYQLQLPTSERQFYLLLNEIEFNTNLYQRYMSVLQAVRYYCEQVQSSTASGAPTLCQRVTEYIDKHYMDSNLCLDSIAAEFHVSPKYLSRHFKENTNCYISAFITNTRMKQACLLLKDRSISIPDLTGMCGYANINTFYKAFKRYWGMSPGAFRGSMDDRKGE